MFQFLFSLLWHAKPLVHIAPKDLAFTELELPEDDTEDEYEPSDNEIDDTMHVRLLLLL